MSSGAILSLGFKDIKPNFTSLIKSNALPNTESFGDTPKPSNPPNPCSNFLPLGILDSTLHKPALFLCQHKCEAWRFPPSSLPPCPLPGGTHLSRTLTWFPGHWPHCTANSCLCRAPGTLSIPTQPTSHRNSPHPAVQVSPSCCCIGLPEKI